MAIDNLTGFESGASGELQGTGGTFSIQTTVKKTGDYALRVNPTTTATGQVNIGTINANGILATDALSTVYMGFWFRYATKPAANDEIIAGMFGSLADTKGELRINSAGNLVHYNKTPTLVATGGTALVVDTWYYIEYQVVNSATGAYDVRINGTTEISGTADHGTGDTVYIQLGKNPNRNGNTVDFYYDDWYVDTAAFHATTTIFQGITRHNPNGAGASAGWTNGTGTTFAEVDEVPPESDGADLTYIQASATEDNTYHTLAVQSTTDKSVIGTVKAVKAYVWAKTGSTTGTSAVSPRIRNAGTNLDKTQAEMTTAYRGHHILTETDPATSAAWTAGGVDTVEVGMVAGTLAQTQRFSAAYIFVMAGDAAPPAPTGVAYRRTLLGVGP